MSLSRNQRRCKRAAAGNSYRVSCSASDFEEGELISGVKAGDKLKVKESRIVYHSPKHKVTIAQSARSWLHFKDTSKIALAKPNHMLPDAELPAITAPSSCHDTMHYQRFETL